MLEFRTNKRWRDADDLVIDWTQTDGMLEIMLLLEAVRERRLETSIQAAQWRLCDDCAVYETCRTMHLPAGGVVKVWAVED